MKIKTIIDFLSQYTGEWAPCEGHWYGLNFSYNGTRYRFNTWSPGNDLRVLPDGRKARFGLLKNTSGSQRYTLLGEYASAEDALFSTVIDNIPFSRILMDNATELISQD